MIFMQQYNDFFKNKRYFITGTDTDAGKTYVTCKFMNDLISNNYKAIAIKPIASGCVEYGGVIKSHDEILLQTANQNSNINISGWRFMPAIAPHIAAQQENINISITELADFCDDFKVPEYDTVLIEGAGGLMVPLNQNKQTWVDFLIYTQIPVILVVGIKLGCINHALLTTCALNTHSIKLAGWVANVMDPNMPALQENIDTLKSYIQAPLIY